MILDLASLDSGVVSTRWSGTTRRIQTQAGEVANLTIC